MKQTIAAIGNIYLETIYHNLETAGADVLASGKEYRSDRYEIRPAGSPVNFARQMTHLGQQVSLVGKIGNDEIGKILLGKLHDEGIGTDMLAVDSTVQTSIDSGLVFSHSGESVQVVSGNANQHLQFVDISIRSGITTCYIAGFVKQVSLYKDYPEMLRLIKKMNIPIFFDHGRMPVDMSLEMKNVLVESLRYVDYYLPNSGELMDVSGVKNLKDAVQWAKTRGVGHVVVKNGADGCMADGDEFVGFPVKPIHMVGAGDTFNAAFVYCILKGFSVSESARFANAAAALYVSSGKNPSEIEIRKIMI